MLPPRTHQAGASHLSSSHKENKLEGVSERDIELLCSEGNDRNAVITALSITKNDVNMAREILQSFVPRSN